MSEKRLEDDGVEYTNNYNYELLDTHYQFNGERIIEWNKHSSNAEYTDFERITEILNIKQMRLESLMKHREEVGKLFDRINEQQSTICKLQDLCGKSDGENAKLRIENKRLQEENEQLKKYCTVLKNQIKKMGEIGGFNKHMIKTILESNYDD